ncbi:15724_t:CDS:2, partial [Dentiscutata erythropus]
MPWVPDQRNFTKHNAQHGIQTDSQGMPWVPDQCAHQKRFNAAIQPGLTPKACLGTDSQGMPWVPDQCAHQKRFNAAIQPGLTPKACLGFLISVTSPNTMLNMEY